jgi:hypothetical protein
VATGENSALFMTTRKNKRKADDELEDYNSSKIHTLPGSYAHLIPLAKITPELHKWTRNSFPAIEVGGKLQPWLDVYFERVHPRYPLLSVDFVRNNYQKLPMFLLHAMYALALATSIDRDSIYSPGDYHYSHCKLLFENHRHEPNPFFICATMLMSVYQIMYTTAVIGGVSLLSVAIRMAQEVGVFRLEDITWTCSDGSVLGVQTGTSKRFLQLIAYFLYESDLYTSFLRKLPFLIQDDIAPLAEYISQDQVTYNSFYELGIWRDAFKLLQTGQHIVMFMRDETIELKGQKWNKKLQQLDQELSEWFDSANECLKQSYDSYSPTLESDPENAVCFYAGYIYSLYQFFRSLLYKPLFLYHLEHENFKDPSIAIVRECTYEIAKVYKLLTPISEYFEKLPFFAYFIAYTFGSNMCFLTLVETPPHYEESFGVAVGVLEHYAIVTPQISHRTQSLHMFKENPKEGIKNYGQYT